MPAELVDWSSRLLLAAVLSGLVGFERQTRQKAAGLRTHMLVGLGAALFTLVGASAFPNSESSRVAAQVVTGVGFLGAGAILREGVTVVGLTTAAGLWAVAAIGMTAGIGLPTTALIATVIALTILYGLRIIESALRRRRATGLTRPVQLRLANLKELSEIVALTAAIDDGAKQIGIERREDDRFLIELSLRPDRIQTVVAALRPFDSVMDVGEADPLEGS